MISPQEMMKMGIKNEFAKKEEKMQKERDRFTALLEGIKTEDLTTIKNENSTFHLSQQNSPRAM